MLSKINLNGRRVLISGASGFIGSALIRKLRTYECEVFALIRPTSDLYRFSDIEENVKFIFYDVENTSIEQLSQQIPDLDIMFHMAATGVNQASDKGSELIATNVLLTRYFLEFALKKNVECFVYLGSGFEYGAGERLPESTSFAPRSSYAVSKSVGWLQVQAYAYQNRIPTTTIRPFVVYGPAEAPTRLTSSVVRAAVVNGRIPLTDGLQKVDMLFIDDLLDGLILASVSREAIGQTFNICSGVPVSVRDIVQTILDVLGSEAVPEFGAIASRASEAEVLTGDWSHAHQILGWKPRTTLKSGLRQTVEWILKQEKLWSSVKMTG